jgi:hypothetical protein
MLQSFRAKLYVLFLTFGVLPFIGCGTIEQEVILELEQPSEMTIEFPSLPPPNDLETTELVGGVITTITTRLGLFELLGMFVGQAIPGEVAVDGILIAGTEIVIADVIPLGTMCIAGDAENPSDGMVYLNPLLGVAAFDMSLNMLVHATDPWASQVLGGPKPFSQEVNATTTLTMGDLLDLLAGGTGGLSVTQDVEAELGPLPLFGLLNVTGTLSLAAADAFPTDPLIDECLAYLLSL